MPNLGEDLDLRGLTNAQKMSALKKTIDSEDEDGDVIVQARNRSRAARNQKNQKSREPSEAGIKLLNVNIELDQVNAQSRLPVNERIMNKTEDVIATSKDKQLEEALSDKRKLLSLLTKVKATFEGFKKRHTDITVPQNEVEAAGESGSTERSMDKRIENGNNTDQFEL